jgi:hypothetical protein
MLGLKCFILIFRLSLPYAFYNKEFPSSFRRIELLPSSGSFSECGGKASLGDFERISSHTTEKQKILYSD